MIQSLKKFRKRHLSNDAIAVLFPLGPCGRATTEEETTKLGITQEGEDDTEVGDDDALPHKGSAADIDEQSVSIRHAMEPKEIDHPMRCPHQEPCIIQDGRALKERLPSLKRKGQLPFLTQQEVQNLRWNRRPAPNDCHIYPTASAPESSFTASAS